MAGYIAAARFALATALTLTACHRTSAPAPPSAPTPTVAVVDADLISPPAQATNVVIEANLAGANIQVSGDLNTCSVTIQRPGAERETHQLDLSPPCYLMLWTRPPPREAGADQGRPVGDVGEVMAWRYPHAKGMGSTAFAVIGDPVADAMRGKVYKTRTRDGFKCAGSVQGVVFRSKGIQISKKRNQVAVFCAELGLEEKDFWLIAHE